MGSPAQLDRETVAHRQHTHTLRVLFAEQCHRSLLARRLYCHLLSDDFRVTQDFLINTLLNLTKFFIGDRFKVGKIKPKLLIVNERAPLIDVRAKYFPQRCVKQMRRRVMPRSRGGGDSWDNVTTACMRCNVRKGNRTPQEAAMPLRKMPRRPLSSLSFDAVRQINSGRHSEWAKYVIGA